MGKLKGLQFNAEWKPRENYVPTEKEKKLKMALVGSNIWHNPSIKLIEKELRPIKPKEVLIKIGACGICGSDLHFLGSDEDNYLRYSGHCAAGTIIGHEYSGEIISIGSEVVNLKVGDLVVADTMNWCGECEACRMGMPNQCSNLEELGFTRDGGFAEYMIAEAKYCHIVNGFLDKYGTKEKTFQVAALIEPISIAYNAMFSNAGANGFAPGSYVAITGAGPVGLAAVALAKVAGAAKVLCLDLVDSRLEMAKAMGADVIINSGQISKDGGSVADLLMNETHGTGIKLHVEATGAFKHVISDIQKSLAIGARVCQIGMGFGEAPIVPGYFQKNAAAFGGTIGGTGHGIWANIIRLISEGKLEPSALIGGVYSLDDVLQGFEFAAGGAPGKIIVMP